ncbi:MAG: RNA polymerase sigma factor SigA [bacterium ADurb.Bin236]|nr:MAG: RNA polymerase sigma factor SigA [bacterium ADurb.Bin236]
MSNAQTTQLKSDKKTRDILLSRLMCGDDSARRDFIEANLPLVYSIAGKYAADGDDFEDIVQEGIIGLIRALEKYDHSLGYQFSTYATWWIRQAIERYLYTCVDTIKRPSQFGSHINRISCGEQDFRSEAGRMPTLKELSHYTGLDEDRIKNLQALYAGTLSLDAPLTPDNRNNLYYNIEGPDSVEEDVIERCKDEEIKEIVDDALSGLSEREQMVLKMRYGLDGGKEKTLREIARLMGISAERVRQLENAAFGKLRSLKKIRRIRSCLN